MSLDFLRKLAVPSSSAGAAVLFGGLALVLALLQLHGQSFYAGLLTRALILGLAAMALDLVVGSAGLVSLGHAAFLGVGAYCVGILAEHGITDGLVHLSTVVIVTAGVAATIGALSLRTRGVHFIMITLAFAQMLYFIANSASRYGGNDGLTIWTASTFPGSVSLSDRTTLSWVAYAVLAGAYLALRQLRASLFGRALRAARENEARIEAMGIPVRAYRLWAFVVSGVLTGLAGALLANLTEFVAPAYLSWHRSGELLAMVVLGGLGTLQGAVIGALLFVVLEEVLASFTTHWAVPFGAFLVLAVLVRNAAASRRGSDR